MVRVVVLMTIAGCGRVGFETRDGGFGGDGLPSDGAGGACAGTVLFKDSFDDGVPGPLFTATPDTGLTLQETGGRLEIQFAPMVAAGNYAHYRSVDDYPAEGLCIVVEVDAVPAHPQAGVYMKCRTASQEIEFFKFGGTLDLRTKSGGTLTTERSLQWDPVAFRFWRLIHGGGLITWETSLDGISFTLQHVAPGFNVTRCHVELGAGAIMPVDAGGAAWFQGIAVLGP